MSIPFDVPSRFADELARGSLTRYGTILKEVGTGRIVGHLQETGALHAAAQAAIAPVASLVHVASAVAGNVQLYRIDAKVAALRALLGGVAAMQAAGLALSGIGLGVSILGFAATRSRLDRSAEAFDRVLAEVRQGFRDIEAKEGRKLDAALAGQLDNAEEGWHARDGGRAAWGGVAMAMGELEQSYLSELQSGLRNAASPGLISNLVERYGVCVATKVECFVLTDEFEQAESYARKAAKRTRAAVEALDPMALATTFRDGGEAAGETSLLDRARDLLAGLREMEDRHATAPALLRTIAASGGGGRAFVEGMRNEAQEPVVILPATTERHSPPG